VALSSTESHLTSGVEYCFVLECFEDWEEMESTEGVTTRRMVGRNEKKHGILYAGDDDWVLSARDLREIVLRSFCY
jgi:hypothetical protein